MDEMTLLNVSGDSRLLVVVFYFVLGITPLGVFYMLKKFMD
jgi:hypothetical protein